MMSDEYIENIIGNIDDDFLYEADKYMQKKNSFVGRLLNGGKKIAACFFIAAIALFASLYMATAAGIVPAYDILYSMYPDLAVKLISVNKSCVSNGIKMSVEGVHISGENAYIYVSIQDVVQDRIDRTTDLFDSYSINIPVGSISGCSMINYDDDSKTAYFLVEIQQDKKIEGRIMTFSVREILSKKYEVTKRIEQITLDDVEEKTQMTNLQLGIDITGRSGEDPAYYVRGYLIPDEEQSFVTVEGVTITAYGFIDGNLHIQAHYEDTSNTDNHGFIDLVDGDGTIIHPIKDVSFWDEEKTGQYDEYIFCLPEGTDYSEYYVQGYFCTCKPSIKGNWKVKFPIMNQE